jgi:hypothetical protein
MLSTHLRHRELYRVRNLTWRRPRRVRRFATAQLPGQGDGGVGQGLVVIPVASSPQAVASATAPRQGPRCAALRVNEQPPAWSKINYRQR